MCGVTCMSTLTHIHGFNSLHRQFTAAFPHMKGLGTRIGLLGSHSVVVVEVVVVVVVVVIVVDSTFAS